MLVSLLCALPLLGLQSLASEAESTDQERWVSAELARLETRYRELHANPELSFHEVETAARLAKVLAKQGFEVTTGVGGHGIVGVLRNGSGPTVLVRTDLDALPIIEQTGLEFASKVLTKDDLGREVGVMHACGHDVHMTVWSGTAEFLAQHRELWQGTAVFIGQPAEERGAGARMMIADGLFERFPKPDYTLGLHVDGSSPAGKVGYTKGYCFANVDTVDIVVKGKGGHGSAPHTTHDPIALSARIIMGLQTIVSREVKPIEDAVVTVGSIHGGTKHNIIPDEVKLQITVRSYKDEVRDQVLSAIARVAQGEAVAAGFPSDLMPEVTVNEDEFTPAAYNDPALVERVNERFRAVLGEEAVFEIEPTMGGEDFGRYAKSADVPGYMFRLGSISQQRWVAAQRPGAPPLPSLHTKHYAPVAGKTIRTGVVAMTTAALELLEKP